MTQPPQPYPGQQPPGQQPPPQQTYQPPQQYPQAGPTGPTGPTGPSGPETMIKFVVQGSVLTSNLVPASVVIDGHRMSAPVGSTLLRVPPGRRHIEASSQWMRTYGQASLDCDVAPGTTLEVFYAPPWHQFTRGSMGLTKQSRNGVGLLIGIGVFVVLIIVLIVVGATLS